LRFGLKITDRVLSVLEKIADSSKSDDTATYALWSALRNLVSHHERHADAKWAFPKRVRTQLAAVRDRLNPADAVLKSKWLFTYRAELPGFDIVKDHVAHDQALNSARISALREINTQTGAAGLFRLLDLGADANTVGWLVGQNLSLDWENAELPG